jgi:hypothetical protein
LWISALAKLSADDRLRLNFGQTNRRLILEDLNKILIQKQQLCLDKRWKFVNGRGQTVIVRDLFEKISHYVRKFTDIVDIAVQYDPAHAALPWAAVRFFLQVSL